MHAIVVFDNKEDFKIELNFSINQVDLSLKDGQKEVKMIFNNETYSEFLKVFRRPEECFKNKN